MTLTIKTRMYINLAILATALVVVGGIGLTTLNRAAGQMHSLYAENLVPIHQIDEVFQRSLQSQQFRLEAYVHRDPAFTQANYDAIKANRARINELLKEIDGVEFGKEEKALSDQIRSQRASLVSIGKQEIDALLSGDYAAATRIRLEQIEPIIDSMDASTQRLTDLRRARAQEMIVSVKGEIARDRWIILLSFAASLGLALVFAWRLTRYVTDGLIKASECATRVSTGELGKSVDSTSQDEIGDVLRALHRMDGALLKIAKSLAHSANEVDSAARRFSEGSDDLSERTQQQAAALEETAASTEQMAATIKHTTDNTSRANQLVANTKVRADESGNVLDRTVEAMDAISASSRQIEDIIGVIDEIAFQTNLLALNAAVEAARAGEQGRGFAVVAGEVRSLAQRSASAAKEIKSLITDSVEKVSAGSSLVSDSGEKLSAIVTDVKQIADLVHEMSAAAQEQSAGINQINQAVSNMDGATQQNAALVEESSAAAKLLQQQAQELHELVAFFKFSGNEGMRVPATRAYHSGSLSQYSQSDRDLERAAA